jgi:hypothetical protein
VNSRESASRAS